MEYLCETRPEHGLGRAIDDAERAEYLIWLHYAETMANPIANLNLQWVFLRDPAARSDVVVKIEARRLALTMAPLEEISGASGRMCWPPGFPPPTSCWGST